MPRFRRLSDLAECAGCLGYLKRKAPVMQLAGLGDADDGLTPEIEKKLEQQYGIEKTGPPPVSDFLKQLTGGGTTTEKVPAKSTGPFDELLSKKVFGLSVPAVAILATIGVVLVRRMRKSNPRRRRKRR